MESCLPVFLFILLKIIKTCTNNLYDHCLIMKNYIRFILSFAFFALSSQNQAITFTINKIGCHLNDPTCYIYIDQSVGPADCSANSIRWNKKTSESGKEALSLLLAAHMAGKQVDMAVSEACFSNNPKYPTFVHFSVIK